MIFNRTKNIKISANVEIAVSFFARLKGLLGRVQLHNDSAMVLNRCNSVHSMFMRFPIDLIFLSGSGKILKIITNFKPWRFSPIVSGASQVIELPAGSLSEDLASVGDDLEIK